MTWPCRDVKALRRERKAIQICINIECDLNIFTIFQWAIQLVALNWEASVLREILQAPVLRLTKISRSPCATLLLRGQIWVIRLTCLKQRILSINMVKDEVNEGVQGRFEERLSKLQSFKGSRSISQTLQKEVKRSRTILVNFTNIKKGKKSVCSII